MESKCSKLDELAERSAFKNGGTSANYITANQALRDDITLLLNAQFGSVLSEIQALKDDISSLKVELSECKSKLDESTVREKCLLEKITSMENDKIVDPNNRKCAKDEFYIVGSSILREVRDTDVINRRVKSISGGKIDDVKENIQSIKYFSPEILSRK